MLNLADQLSDLPERRGRAPWEGYGYARGWGVFAQPFDSGHVLGLRVFPENDFAGYRAFWHEDPEGRFSVWIDGPRLDTACPRYMGPACDRVGYADIDVQWTGPTRVTVRMDDPPAQWSMTVHEPPLFRALNAVNARLGLWSWEWGPLVRARELIARRYLGVGRDFALSVRMPAGHESLLMPRRMYPVEDVTATLRGTDLGDPVELEDSVRIGGVPFPARGLLATGTVLWKILDQGEHHRLRAETEPAGVA